MPKSGFFQYLYLNIWNKFSFNIWTAAPEIVLFAADLKYTTTEKIVLLFKRDSIFIGMNFYFEDWVVSEI